MPTCPAPRPPDSSTARPICRSNLNLRSALRALFVAIGPPLGLCGERRYLNDHSTTRSSLMRRLTSRSVACSCHGGHARDAVRARRRRSTSRTRWSEIAGPIFSSFRWPICPIDLIWDEPDRRRPPSPPGVVQPTDPDRHPRLRAAPTSCRSTRTRRCRPGPMACWRFSTQSEASVRRSSPCRVQRCPPCCSRPAIPIGSAH